MYVYILPIWLAFLLTKPFRYQYMYFLFECSELICMFQTNLKLANEYEKKIESVNIVDNIEIKEKWQYDNENERHMPS